MPSEDLEGKFWQFYESVRHNEVLDEKTTVMIHMAAAMALGCYPCMKHYFGQTRELGITEEELATVQAVVMAVSAGRVAAQVQDALAGTEAGPEGADSPS